MADSARQTEVADSPADELFYSGVAKLNAGEFHGAIATFRLAIQNGTDFPAPAHAYTGVAWFELKRYRRAIRQLSRAIRLDPFGQALDDRGYYYRRNRGHAFVSLFRYRRALEDFRFVVEKCTPTADDLSTLGFLYRMHGRYAVAVGAFESSLAIDPHNYAANHGLAYILATCSAASFRDGPRAVQIATLLNEKSRHGNWSDLSLLAGAYAEVGDFDKALEFARLSAAHAPPGAERERLKRVRLYERKKPFRSRPWLDRYRYRLQAKWLAKQQERGHGEASDT